MWLLGYFRISCIAAAESLYFIYTGRLIRLSTQQIVDCAVLDGCKGSTSYFAYWFMKFHGVCAADDYPYTSKVQACDISKPSVAWIDGYSIVGYSKVQFDIKDVLCALSKQPLVGVYNPIFSNHPTYKKHKGGIFYVDETPFELPEPVVKHAVCVVGWYYHQGKVILKIKESKGHTWGDRGFVI